MPTAEDENHRRLQELIEWKSLQEGVFASTRDELERTRLNIENRALQRDREIEDRNQRSLRQIAAAREDLQRDSEVLMPKAGPGSTDGRAGGSAEC